MTQADTASNPASRATVEPLIHKKYQLIIENTAPPRKRGTTLQAALRYTTDIAAIGLMRDCLLTAHECADARWEHLQRRPDSSGLLTVPSTAGNTAEPAEVTYVSEGTMNFLETMLDLRQDMGIQPTDDRIFQIGSRQLARRIRDACSSAGLEGYYGGTSPRIGMVVDLALAGFRVIDIMRAGRWQMPSTPVRQILGINSTDGPVSKWYDLDLTHTALR